MSKGRSRPSQGRRKGRRRRNSKKSDNNKAVEFWGSEDTSVDIDHRVVLVADPTSVVSSLGMPPLSEHSTAAGAYFEAVYHRAAAMSGALAAAGNLTDSETYEHS